jgi:hypothetical protein
VRRLNCGGVDALTSFSSVHYPAMLRPDRNPPQPQVRPPVRSSSLHPSALLSAERPRTLLSSNQQQRASSRKPARPSTAPVPIANRELVWLTSPSSSSGSEINPTTTTHSQPARTDHPPPMRTLMEDEVDVQGALDLGKSCI